MSLADERRSRRFRYRDETDLRVTIAIAGFFLLVPGVLVVITGAHWHNGFGYVLLGALTSLAVLFLCAAFFGGKVLLDRLGNAANHEVFVVFYLLALPISWLIRRVRGR